MSDLASILHPWTCAEEHPDTDGGWLCRRAAADVEFQLSALATPAAPVDPLREALILAHDHHSFGPEGCTPDNCSAEAAIRAFATKRGRAGRKMLDVTHGEKRPRQFLDGLRPQTRRSPMTDPLREALDRLVEAGVTPERGPWKAEGGSIGFRSPHGFHFSLIGEDIEALVNAALASPAAPRPEGLDDPWQWLHDNEFSWDDVNAIAAILAHGGFDIVCARLSDTGNTP